MQNDEKQKNSIRHDNVVERSLHFEFPFNEIAVDVPLSILGNGKVEGTSAK